MLEALSQTDKVFRDTTLSSSSGEQFDVVCRHWGVPYVYPTPEAHWREVALSNAMAPRGVSGTVFQFVRWALAKFAVSIPVTVSPTHPDRITAATGTPFLESSHVGLLCLREDTNEVFYINGPVTTGPLSYLTLTTETNGAYWVRANFTASEEFSVSILPFVITEEPGHVIIHVRAASISFSPPTYIQPDADARPVGQPQGGQLQESSLTQVGDPLGAGPYPIYLSSGNLFDEYADVLTLLLVNGVRASFRKMG